MSVEHNLDIYRLGETHGIFRAPGHSPYANSEALGWRSVLVVLEHDNAPFQLQCDPVKDYLIVLQLKGATRLRWRIEGRSEAGTGVIGAVSFIPAGAGFRLFGESATDTAHIYVRHQLLDEIAAELGPTESGGCVLAPCLAVRDPMLEQLASGCVSALEQPGVLSSTYVDHLAWAMAAHLVRSRSTRFEWTPRAAVGMSRPKLERVRDYVAAHLEQGIALGDLARVAALSPTYFARSFKRALGMAPYQYVLNMRVEKVKTLLRSDAHTLAEIAALCGFCHQEHMTRVFRRMLGLTPGDYRAGRHSSI